MHELALCDALLKMVRDISREEALDGVRSITVRVGTLSGVIPHFLTDCWVAVTDGTVYDGVPLRVETEAGRARCLDCGAEFEADVNDLPCPGCGCHQDRDRKERRYPPDERRVPDGRAAGPAGRRRGWLWRGGLAA